MAAGIYYHATLEIKHDLPVLDLIFHVLDIPERQHHISDLLPTAYIAKVKMQFTLLTLQVLAWDRDLLAIAEESRTHTVLSGKYLHLLQRKYSQYLILLRIFSLHLRNICSRKTAQHPPALYFLMDFVKARRSKIRILQDEIWRKTRKILAAGRSHTKAGSNRF